jgi:hypothetical protein
MDKYAQLAANMQRALIAAQVATLEWHDQDAIDPEMAIDALLRHLRQATLAVTEMRKLPRRTT